GGGGPATGPCAAAGLRSAAAWRRSRKVEAWHALRHPAGDLVLDEAGAVGELARADALLPLRAEKDGLIADGDAGDLGHVDHRHVHAHRADDRAAAPADEHLAA